jgi:hypothetical protein
MLVRQGNYDRGTFDGTQRALRLGINQILMNNKFESTYAMLVRSEENGRRILEFFVYAVFAVSAAMSILQFASA